MNHISTCSNCGRAFKPSSPYQLRCSEACDNEMEKKIEEKHKEIFEYVCVECGAVCKKSEKNKHPKYCYPCLRQIGIDQKREKGKLEPKEKKPPKRRLSIEELDKIAERKRVWEDKGWSHYLKGRKWDRI